MKLLLRYTAKTVRAEIEFRKWLDVRDKNIKNIEVVTEKPFVVEVTPRINRLYLKAINTMKHRKDFMDTLALNVCSGVDAEMQKNGVSQTEYSVEVIA